ncbi:MAG TPA: P1 family peptidase [Acidimicrobiia bacterium]|nr:P1 family peptidase [Acidimicrobiia bacterium]
MFAGLRVGHWTGDATGVTVIVAPSGTVGSGEVRGGAPATRELALLEPTRTVARVDAVVLTGGSAFGLRAADGVMRFLAERGQGFPTAGGPVPIVPTAAIFDLVESGGAVPSVDDGYAAAVAALRDEPLVTGRVGAGRAATIGKWRGAEHAVSGGFGVARVTTPDGEVVAFAVVNAVGDVLGPDGAVLAGTRAPIGEEFASPVFGEPGANTTLVVVATDAALDKVACHLMAQSAHDGLARALRPAHTRFDGDLAIALATATAPPPTEPDGLLDRIRIAASDVTADAIRAAVAAVPGTS